MTPRSTPSEPTGATSPPGPEPGPLARLVGGPVELDFRRSVPDELGGDAVARVAARIRGLAGRTGTAVEAADSLEWRSEGRLDRIVVTVEPRRDAGGTSIRLRGDRSVTAMLLLALVVGGWVIAFGVSVARLQPASTTEVAALGVGYLLAALAAGRTVWSRTGRRFRRLLTALAEEVTLEVTARSSP